MSTLELIKKQTNIIIDNINNIDIKYLEKLHIICTKKNIIKYNNYLLCDYPILDTNYNKYILELEKFSIELKNILLNDNNNKDIKTIIEINLKMYEITFLYTILQLLKECINIINLLK